VNPTQITECTDEKQLCEWVSCLGGMPNLGVKVIIYSNGAVQEETYTLDQGDSDFGGGEYFWSREDLDECPAVDFEKDAWMYLPKHH
jgi:hypothetical protein